VSSFINVLKLLCHPTLQRTAPHIKHFRHIWYRLSTCHSHLNLRPGKKDRTPRTFHFLSKSSAYKAWVSTFRQLREPPRPSNVFSGSEIYVGCSNGDLLRFALKSNVSEQVNTSYHSETTQPASYTLLSRQTLPTGKSIDEIVLVPSISRALVLSGA
jgi:hypothetical protein